ncbi:unnamed protein product [Trichogramma brassicae]|uniref:Uncharacterized protein n=1 Tax=Trichogramma brassicae TaxID=86971 RepID=A0A6H5HXR6_9HYME|nr:unnamed protein product [Trichogramma brassicae]
MYSPPRVHHVRRVITTCGGRTLSHPGSRMDHASERRTRATRTPGPSTALGHTLDHPCVHSENALPQGARGTLQTRQIAEGQSWTEHCAARKDPVHAFSPTPAGGRAMPRCPNPGLRGLKTGQVRLRILVAKTPKLEPIRSVMVESSGESRDQPIPRRWRSYGLRSRRPALRRADEAVAIDKNNVRGLVDSRDRPPMA